jgi:hypothetical protein
MPLTTLYWLGLPEDANKVQSVGFSDEKILDEPPTFGVFLAEEHYLAVGQPTKEPLVVLAVAIQLSEDDAAKYVMRASGWPMGGYAFPAHVLNDLRPSVSRLSRIEFLSRLIERGNEWRQRVEDEKSLSGLDANGLENGGDEK